MKKSAVKFFTKKIIFLLVFCVIALLPLSAEEQNEEESLYQSRYEKLYYGTDAEITDLLDTLINDEDYAFSEDIASLFEKTRSDSVKAKIFDYYIKAKDPRLTDACKVYLANPYDEKKSILEKVFAYCSSLEITEVREEVVQLLEDENEDFLNASIKLLGKVGTEEDVPLLKSYLDKEISVPLKEAVVTAIGDIGVATNWETLLEIANDKDEATSMRMIAIEALGKLETDETVESLIKLYEETDSNVRYSVVKALATHKSDAVTSLITEAIRDSYFRVRIEAMSIAKEQQLYDTVPSILYRAKNDSEAVVKNKAYEVLAAIGDRTAIDYLLGIVKGTKQGESVRGKVASYLLMYDFDIALDTIIETAEKCLKDDRYKNLRYALGKEFAKYNNANLESICQKYLEHKDVATKGTGLDIFRRNAFANLTPMVQAMAENSKEGANQKKARYILDLLGL